MISWIIDIDNCKVLLIWQKTMKDQFADERKRWTRIISIPLSSHFLLFFLFLVPHHEYRGPAGRDCVCDGEGAVPWPQPRHSYRGHRCPCGATAWWVIPVFPFPRALRQAGRAALQGENCGCFRCLINSAVLSLCFLSFFDALMCHWF